MSFLFPAYLLGFLGLALPWILHRFSDQQAPEQPFPSREFLESTTPPVSRRKTLRYKALLALRIAALLLLCTLFAEPWINRSGAGQSSQQHHLVALDVSLSMRADGRWDEALAQASSIVEDFGQTQPMDIVSFDQGLSVLASSNTEAADGVLPLTNALRDVEPGFGSADYGVLLQRLDKLAAEKELPVKLWLISDLQQNSLPAQLNALYAPNISELQIVNVAPTPQSNVHLQARATAKDGVNAQVRVSLLWSRSSSGDAEKPSSDTIKRTVQVSFNDKVLASREVDLAEGELTIVNFDSLTKPAQERPSLRVSLVEPDDLPDDNQQIILFDQTDPANVVLLRPSRSAEGNASVFLTTAMETDALASVTSVAGAASQVPQDTSHLVTGRDIDKTVDLDVLQFVDKSNSALVFNTAEPVTDVVDSLIGSEVGVLDESHPLALGDIDWFGTRFYSLPEMQVTDQDRVLIATSDRQVLLMERSTNRGRLLLLNDPLNGLASNLPFQPAFVSLMQAVISYFDANTSIASSALVGERVALPPGVQVLDSNDQPMLGLGSNQAPSSVVLDLPGLYTIVGARGEQILKVELDPVEANLTSLPSASLQAWETRYTDAAAAGAVAATAAAAGAVAANTASVDRSESSGIDLSTVNSATNNLKQSLWYWLLPLAVVVFLLEAWFANRRLDVRRDGS